MTFCIDRSATDFIFGVLGIGAVTACLIVLMLQFIAPDPSDKQTEKHLELAKTIKKQYNILSSDKSSAKEKERAKWSYCENCEELRKVEATINDQFATFMSDAERRKREFNSIWNDVEIMDQNMIIIV